MCVLDLDKIHVTFMMSLENTKPEFKSHSLVKYAGYDVSYSDEQCTGGSMRLSVLDGEDTGLGC